MNNAPPLGFDLETTGTDEFQDRIVTASTVDPDGQAQEWLVDPGVEIPDGAASKHGITTEHAQKHGDKPQIALPEIAATLEAAWAGKRAIVAFNAPFDLSMINAELVRHGFEGLPIGGLVIDPLVIDRAVDRYRSGKRTLTACAKHYGVRLDNAHASSSDAHAAIQVWQKQKEAYPELANAAADDLMRWQTKWYADWAANFQSWLRDRKREDGESEETIANVIIPTEWPIRVA